MTIVQAATHSKSFEKKESSVYPLGDQKQNQKKNSALLQKKFPNSKSDHLEISNDSQDFVKTIDLQIEKILNTYPKFASLYLQKGNSNFSRKQQFLADESMHNLCKNNQEFATFFQSIQEVDHNQRQLFSQVQNKLKQIPQNNYMFVLAS